MSCKCIEFVDKAIEPKGVKLDLEFCADEKLNLHVVPVIKIKRIDGGRLKKGMAGLNALFCPFCGHPYKEGQKPVPQTLEEATKK